MEKARHGIIVEAAFVYPLILIGQGGAHLRLGKVEIGIQDTVGEHMLDTAGQQCERATQVGQRPVLNKQRFPQPLPDVAGGPAALYYGYDAIPTGWIVELKRKEWIEELCGKADRVIG